MGERREWMGSGFTQAVRALPRCRGVPFVSSLVKRLLHYIAARVQSRRTQSHHCGARRTAESGARAQAIVVTARNLLSRPPHRKRSERGRASGSEGVCCELLVERLHLDAEKATLHLAKFDEALHHAARLVRGHREADAHAAAALAEDRGIDPHEPPECVHERAAGVAGLQGICFRARRTGNGQNGDGRRGVRGSGGSEG